MTFVRTYENPVEADKLRQDFRILKSRNICLVPL